ncbi:MAG: cell envelope integrity protein CreD [Pseudomonadota bacterium]
MDATQTAAPAPGKRQTNVNSFMKSLGVKFFLVGFLTVLLAIPLFAVWGITYERAETQRRAVTEIGTQWGAPQSLTGPFLVARATKTVVENTNDGQQRRRTVPTTLVFTPGSYEVTSEVTPEVRKRSIYEAVVYRTEANLTARFDGVQNRALPSHIVSVDWTSARLSTALTDMRGIEVVETNVNGRDKNDAQPGLGDNSLQRHSGFHYRIDEQFLTDTLLVEQKLTFRGSSDIHFAPIGADTNVSMSSKWPHPSFSGRFLPTERTVSEEGFTATWTIPELARQIPSVIEMQNHGSFASLSSNEQLGVRLYQPVDHYRFVDRAVKYGIMFISVTFLVVFVIEVLSKRRMHIVHYAMTGLMVIVFYVLLLALAERLGFAVAYAIAGGATGGVIAAFTASIFNGRLWTMIAVGAFTALYGLLYVILSLEEFALLAGAVSAFVVLTAVMFATRDTDWSGRSGDVSMPEQMPA